MALSSSLPAFPRTVAAATILSLLGACTLPTNVALKDVDSLRAAEADCLRTNVARLMTGDTAPEAIARAAAASCRDRTGKLASYVVPNASLQERQAFEEDAVTRASRYAKQSIGSN